MDLNLTFKLLWSQTRMSRASFMCIVLSAREINTFDGRFAICFVFYGRTPLCPFFLCPLLRGPQVLPEKNQILGWKLKLNKIMNTPRKKIAPLRTLARWGIEPGSSRPQADTRTAMPCHFTRINNFLLIAQKNIDVYCIYCVLFL